MNKVIANLNLIAWLLALVFLPPLRPLAQSAPASAAQEKPKAEAPAPAAETTQNQRTQMTGAPFGLLCA
jgi:hypothetical protein